MAAPEAESRGDDAPRYSDRRLVAIANRVHQGLLDDGEVNDVDGVEAGDLRARVFSAAPLCTEAEAARIAAMVTDQLDGFGPLAPILADPSVTEVMINGPGPIWVEQSGELVHLDDHVDQAGLRRIIDRIVGPLGLRLDRVVPFADGRLPDGSRVHLALPPQALDGPYITIRRFGTAGRTLADFVTGPRVELLLRLGVRRRHNLVVTGGTGSGKTSLLNALAAAIQTGERIVTLEDAAELRLAGSHVVRLEARPANAEGVGEITMRTLVRNALRMRPDRIVVGEVRGAEAFDMIQAMNTGHSGSMSTCHANSPRDTLDRLAAMTMMADVSLSASLAQSQVRAALGWVVRVARGPGGARLVQDVVDVDTGTELVHRGELTSAGSLRLAAQGRNGLADPGLGDGGYESA